MILTLPSWSPGGKEVSPSSPAGAPFETGSSWWPFQLHYGGLDPADWGDKRRDYRYLGDTPGQGNGFTKLTGWEPGDPDAWRDSIRYALNRAKSDGWGAWYGAKANGVTWYDGIDREHPWDADAELWDYEGRDMPEIPAVEKVRFNPAEPPHLQEHDYDCAQDSWEWAMWSVGRSPTDGWEEETMIREGVLSRDLGLLDASGAGLAAFTRRHYGSKEEPRDIFDSNHTSPVSWDAVVAEVNPQSPYPVLLGGKDWNHWSGLYGYDPVQKELLLANPSPGWGGVFHRMNRQQWDRLGPFSVVRILHPDLLEAPAKPVEPVQPGSLTTPREIRDAIEDVIRRIVVEK